METSKHQQLFLAEDHAVPAATRRTARCPGKTQGLKSHLAASDVCKNVHYKPQSRNPQQHAQTGFLFYMIELGFKKKKKN